MLSGLTPSTLFGQDACRVKMWMELSTGEKRCSQQNDGPAMAATQIFASHVLCRQTIAQCFRLCNPYFSQPFGNRFGSVLRVIQPLTPPQLDIRQTGRGAIQVGGAPQHSGNGPERATATGIRLAHSRNAGNTRLALRCPQPEVDPTGRSAFRAYAGFDKLSLRKP